MQIEKLAIMESKTDIVQKTSNLGKNMFLPLVDLIYALEQTPKASGKAVTWAKVHTPMISYGSKAHTW